MSQKIYLTGRFVDREDARVSVFDHGFLYGDGVFEGIRAYSGRVFRLREHIERLYRSARCLMLAKWMKFTFSLPPSYSAVKKPARRSAARASSRWPTRSPLSQSKRKFSVMTSMFLAVFGRLRDFART